MHAPFKLTDSTCVQLFCLAVSILHLGIFHDVIKSVNTTAREIRYSLVILVDHCLVLLSSYTYLYPM